MQHRHEKRIAVYFLVSLFALSLCRGAEFTNSIGMVFARIPISPISNGSVIEANGLNSLPKSSRPEPTNSFWLGVTEVTQEQWDRVMGTNESFHKGSNMPVEFVSWAQAVEFCQKLGRKEGRGYRLPTECEWEYACRGGGANSSTNGLDKVAWTWENGAHPMPVGKLTPNSFGLFDMQGNVAEWCSDTAVWKDDQGNIRKDGRVAKGGAFLYGMRDALPEAKLSYQGGPNSDARWVFIGFRVLCRIEGAPISLSGQMPLFEEPTP